MEKVLVEDDDQEFKGVQLQIKSELQKDEKDEESDTESVAKLNYNDGENQSKENTIKTSNSWSKRLTDTIWRTNSENKVQSNQIMVAKPFEKENPHDYFSFRDNLVENSIKECKEKLLSSIDDGEYKGSWLLTEISLWDNEKERLILLSDKYIITVKYDFIALRLLDYRKISLHQIDTIVNGDLVYPPNSLIPERGLQGIRLMWNNGAPLPFTKRWNPFSDDIPFNTYSSHPLYWHKDGDGKYRNTYDVQDFSLKVIAAIEDARNRFSQLQTAACKIYHKPIVLENYVGLSSVIHNKNALGFFKVRGKFSF